MIEHLDQNYGLEYVGLGASLLFFIKTSKFDANKTPQLLNELSNFYQFSQTTHNQLEQHLSNHEYLILPYVESLEVLIWIKLIQDNQYLFLNLMRLKYEKLLSLSALVLLTTLTGCAVNLPYNNRLNYTSISELSALPKVQDTVYIKWNPDTFPQRIDIQGSDGFVGGGTRTRIPTGVALSSRIEEAIAQIAKLSSNGSPLTITVEKPDLALNTLLVF